MDATSTPAPSDTEDARLDAYWGLRCATLRNAWVQVRYHRRRQRFFDLADKLTKALTVVLGASLMGQYVADALPMVGTAITSLGLLALIFGYADRKQLHKDLAEQAAALVRSIELLPVSALSAEQVAHWAADYAQLCAKAPPPLKTLSLLCEREQAIADGHPDHIPAPGFLRRLLADFKS
ncbi:hypothetical protein [Tibeticola sp.]|uniref:hypothetical protein n=1 Tax=Tibeticola sp. TaxID=2005368 RepID=UPI0025DAFE02|nr:hypothetical protein [Tibeticola sp.]